MNMVAYKKSNRVYKDLYSFKPSNVIILGSDEVKDQLSHFEYKYNIVFKVCSSFKDLKKLLNSKTIAIILDEKALSKNSFKLSLGFGDTPLFFLSRKKRRPSFYTRLYDVGVHGVINWPSEEGILGDFLIESLKPKPLATGESAGDKRLASTIKSHLILAHKLKSIKVSAFDGFIFLTGKVNTIDEKESIESDLSSILGVKKLILKDLKIKKSSNVTSKEIERRVKLYAGTALGKYKRALAFRVKDHILTIKGDVENMSDLKSVISFAKRQKSLIKIINNVKYRPSLVKKRTKRAKLIEEKAKDLFDGVKFISIAIYDSYAEVSGTVLFHADRILVERYLLQMLPVRKVVNKLYIVGNK